MALVTSTLSGQSADPVPAASHGALSGEVIDAETSLPLAGATVTLLPAFAGALLGESTSAFLSTSRTTTTNLRGHYEFRGLAPARYVLRVRRIGYRPATIEVQTLTGNDARISVGLVITPVRMEPQYVRVTRPQPYTTMNASSELMDSSRVQSARVRQRDFLSTDVREMTQNDVRDAGTLAETDLFRALTRIPGVTTRDDYSAELWTRAARADQTRVLFDGVPIYEPHHAFGAFSAVDANALGSALLHPGVRPAGLAEGGAAVLDMQSRIGEGGATGGIAGSAEISLVSARLEADGRSAGGRSAWMLAARRSHVDWLTAALSTSGLGAEIPYWFGDVVGRLDYQLTQQHSVAASALFSHDSQTGDVADVSQGNRAAWGNSLVRLSFTRSGKRLNTRHTLGSSAFSARVDTTPSGPVSVLGYSTITEPPLRSTIRQLSLTSVYESVREPAASSQWKFGHQLTHEALRSDAAAERLFADDPQSTDRLVRNTGVTRLAVWADYSRELSTRLRVAGGLRLDAGQPLANAGAVRFAPHLQGRLQLSQSTTVSAGFGRSWQYAQSIARPLRGANSVLYPSKLWFLADRDHAALRMDIATLGAERWIGSGTLASLNLYRRRGVGMLLPDPRPGVHTNRPLVVSGSELAAGVEFGIRKLSGRTTGALAYSHATATQRAAGLRFPSSQNRRDVLSVSGMTQVSTSWAIGGAYTYGSALPYTRVTRGDAIADGSGNVIWLSRPASEAPNARRGSPYQSLDLLGEFAFRVRGVRLAAFVQLRNVFNKHNDALYIDYEDCIVGGTLVGGCSPGDRFEKGLPLLPVLGLRAWF